MHYDQMLIISNDYNATRLFSHPKNKLITLLTPGDIKGWNI